MARYDLCILGGGSAGIAAAVRAHDLGRSVALVVAGPLGGAGVWNGALSSKTLWHLAMDYARGRRGDRGYRGGDLALVWDDVCAQVAGACGEAEALVAHELAFLAGPGPGGVGRVEVVRGRGRFVAADAIEVRDDGGAAPRRLEAARFLIATGSRPRALDGVVVDGDRVVTSDQIERCGPPPARVAIVGAGVVGCEYATVLASFGATAVELIDRAPRILPFEDEDVSAAITASFEGLGVLVHREARLDDLAVDDDGVTLTIRQGDAVTRRRVDRVLLSIGRVPATDDLGLELAGVARDARGSIVTAADDHTRTTAPHVWAAGDVTADLMLANVAELEGRHAVEDMFGHAPPPLRYDAQSAILFLRPEVATVGLGEQLARQRGVPYRAATVANRLIRRFGAMRATAGFVKLLARPDGRLLGLRMVGPQASSAIQGVALLIERGGTLEELERCMHPHPAVTEGVQEAARLLLGTSMFSPAAFPDDVRVTSG
ncbi:MAG: NAD(P)/FAD-dependent oxidoreductase [Myxococcales bacterium]|nr:NAD(P)/FAD-dependent oxidoreductase [Myxococcales bacterium]